MAAFIRPSVVTHITNSFSGHLKRHSVNPGVDYGAATGTAVRAPASGTVTGAKWSSLVGYWIHIDHDGNGSWGWSSDLLHNSKLLVKPGQWVKQGQIIAYSGGTGSVATGPHIHWTLRHAHGYALQDHLNVDPETKVGAVTVADQFATWLGSTYVKKLQDALGIAQDGAMSAADVKVLQKKLGFTGTAVDGKFGGNSTAALQKFIGVAADRVVGPNTISAWKKAIDAGKFGLIEIIRKTKALPANVRALPSLTGAEKGTAKANTNYVIVAYGHGQKVSQGGVTSDIWFRLGSGYWVWAGAFTSQSINGLPDQTPVVVPPTPESVVEALKKELLAAQGQVSLLSTELGDLKLANANLNTQVKAVQAKVDNAKKALA